MKPAPDEAKSGRRTRLVVGGGIGAAVLGCIGLVLAMQLSGDALPSTAALDSRRDGPSACPADDRRTGGAMPEGQGEWTPVFDGESLGCLGREAGRAWRVENGAIVNIAGVNDAAQSAKEYADGEIRICFEPPSGHCYFAVRQGSSGFWSAHFDGARCAAMKGKTHELVFSCYKDRVTGKLDGRPLELKGNGRPVSGRLQFNAVGGGFRLTGFHYRKFAP